MKTVYTGLVGDVGGTNARLAVVDSAGRIRNPKTYPAKEYSSLTEVIGDDFLLEGEVTPETTFADDLAASMPDMSSIG